MAEERTTSSTGGQKGVKLERFDLIPIGPLTELARHYGVGARKYANHQWRQGYEWSKSYAAAMRHLTAFWAGFDYDVCENDPEGCKRGTFREYGPGTCENHTGSHHMAAVAWHAFLLLEFKDRFPQHDDRYVAHDPEADLPGSPDLPTAQQFIESWVEDYDTWARRFQVASPAPRYFVRIDAGIAAVSEALNRRAD